MPTLAEVICLIFYSLFFIYFTYRPIGRWYATFSNHQAFSYHLFLGASAVLFYWLGHTTSGPAQYVFNYLGWSSGLAIMIALAWSIKYDHDRKKTEQSAQAAVPQPKELSTEEKIEMLLDKNRK